MLDWGEKLSAGEEEGKGGSLAAFRRLRVLAGSEGAGL